MHVESWILPSIVIEIFWVKPTDSPDSIIRNLTNLVQPIKIQIGGLSMGIFSIIQVQTPNIYLKDRNI